MRLWREMSEVMKCLSRCPLYPAPTCPLSFTDIFSCIQSAVQAVRQLRWEGPVDLSKTREITSKAVVHSYARAPWWNSTDLSLEGSHLFYSWLPHAMKSSALLLWLLSPNDCSALTARVLQYWGPARQGGKKGTLFLSDVRRGVRASLWYMRDFSLEKFIWFSFYVIFFLQTMEVLHV